MTLDYNAIAAWSGLAAALIAILGLFVESRRSRFSQGVELILRLEERFDADHMLQLRRRAALSLRSGGGPDVDDVLDFFETVGLLARRRALDDTLVWSTFFYWLHNYIAAAHDHVAAARKEDQTVWEEITRLHDRLLAIERKRRGSSNVPQRPPEEQILAFLEQEANL